MLELALLPREREKVAPHAIRRAVTDEGAAPPSLAAPQASAPRASDLREPARALRSAQRTLRLPSMPNDELIDLNNPRFGATEADRAVFVRKSRVRVVALTLAAIPVGLWALIWPEPRLVVVALLLLIPLLSVAVALHARPAIRVAESERRPGGLDLIIAIGAPSLVLVLMGARTLIDQPPSAILFAGSAAIAAALAWLDPLLRGRWVTLFILVCFGFCYVRGATVEANILLDRAEPTRKEMTVREKRATGRAFVHHELVVSPWIDRGVDREITVTQTLHDTLAVGDRICIDVHPGALGLRWYEVARCSDQARGNRGHVTERAGLTP